MIARIAYSTRRRQGPQPRRTPTPLSFHAASLADAQARIRFAYPVWHQGSP